MCPQIPRKTHRNRDRDRAPSFDPGPDPDRDSERLAPAAPCAAGAGAFTLIEVLVTLVILSAGIVLVLRAFETSLVALGEARDTARAATLLSRAVGEAEAAAVENGEAGLQAAGGFFDAGLDWRVRVAVELEHTAGRAGRTNAVYRVNALAWRDGLDRRYGSATLVRVEQ
jgi:prepilin-type N-terminal cleavage/methylation domain-containing protein